MARGRFAASRSMARPGAGRGWGGAPSLIKRALGAAPPAWGTAAADPCYPLAPAQCCTHMASGQRGRAPLLPVLAACLLHLCIATRVPAGMHAARCTAVLLLHAHARTHTQLPSCLNQCHSVLLLALYPLPIGTHQTIWPFSPLRPSCSGPRSRLAMLRACLCRHPHLQMTLRVDLAVDADGIHKIWFDNGTGARDDGTIWVPSGRQGAPAGFSAGAMVLSNSNDYAYYAVLNELRRSGCVKACPPPPPRCSSEHARTGTHMAAAPPLYSHPSRGMHCTACLLCLQGGEGRGPPGGHT